MTDVEKLIERLYDASPDFAEGEPRPLLCEAADMLRSLVGEIADYERGSKIDHETIRALSAKLERAREGLKTMDEHRLFSPDGMAYCELKRIARATLEELK